MEACHSSAGWSLELATVRIWLYSSARGMCIDFKPLEIDSSAKWPWNYIIEDAITHPPIQCCRSLQCQRNMAFSGRQQLKTNVCCRALPFSLSLSLSRYNALSTRVTHSLPQSSRTVMCRLISRVWSWARWPWISCRRRSMSSFITWRSLWNRSTLCFYRSSQKKNTWLGYVISFYCSIYAKTVNENLPDIICFINFFSSGL